jgi:hypothetical protein
LGSPIGLRNGDKYLSFTVCLGSLLLMIEKTFADFYLAEGEDDKVTFFEVIGFFSGVIGGVGGGSRSFILIGEVLYLIDRSFDPSKYHGLIFIVLDFSYLLYVVAIVVIVG